MNKEDAFLKLIIGNPRLVIKKLNKGRKSDNKVSDLVRVFWPMGVDETITLEELTYYLVEAEEYRSEESARSIVLAGLREATKRNGHNTVIEDLPWMSEKPTHIQSAIRCMLSVNRGACYAAFAKDFDKWRRRYYLVEKRQKLRREKNLQHDETQ